MTSERSEAFAPTQRPGDGGYRSIFFEKGAPHEKYFGWTILLADPGLKIMAQQRGPLRRGLILAQGVPAARIDETVRRLRLLDARTDLVLHDFDDPGCERRTLAGHSFRRAREDERILNKATFVSDLAYDDDALVKSMNRSARRDLHKAQEAGLRVEADDNPSPAILDDFVSNFERTAKERGLSSPGRSTLQRMFDGGNLTLFRVLAGNEVRAAITVYRAGDKAIETILVDNGKTQDGSGRILRFEIMREMRARGVRWYDFGGVASTDESDGIYRFKRGFGGVFVSLGSEYLRRPLFVRTLVHVMRRPWLRAAISSWQRR